jgi:hypothetical protein
MDPEVLPAHLPILTQIEEMVITRSHVQMVLYCYYGYQYHYSGHCVSFMQNIVKTVDVLPNLPSERDVVVYGLWIIWRMKLGIDISSSQIFKFGRVTTSPGSDS